MARGSVANFLDCFARLPMSIGTYIKKTYENNPNLPFRKAVRSIYWRLCASPRRFYRNFKPVNSTKPLKCNPASQTELHTLTCHDHVFMYITAIKSLLRFVSDLAVVVHDDGSLTTKDITTIEHHIVGIKVIRRSEADKIVGKLLAPYPKTASYRSEVINSLELTDHALLAGRDRVIITNSDTLFLRRPDEIMQWIVADDGYVLCVYEKQPVQQTEFLTRMQSSFPPHLTLALVCLHKPVVDPAAIEELISHLEQTDPPWFIGQNLWPVLIGKKVRGDKIKFLDSRLYQASGEFEEGAVFRHYWTSIVNLRPQYSADAAKVIAELKSDDKLIASAGHR
jgi:hypothetical protein